MMLEMINIKNQDFLDAWLADVKKNPNKWSEVELLAQITDVCVVVYIKEARPKDRQLQVMSSINEGIFMVKGLTSLGLIKLSSKDVDPFDFYLEPIGHTEPQQRFGWSRLPETEN